MSRFFWVRHGPTHAKSMVGWSDIPADLTNTAQLARLSALLPADALVVSSDLIRASATADAIVAGRTRLPHDPDLREINFGDWELQKFTEVSDQALIRQGRGMEMPEDVFKRLREAAREPDVSVCRADPSFAEIPEHSIN